LHIALQIQAIHLKPLVLSDQFLNPWWY